MIKDLQQKIDCLKNFSLKELLLLGADFLKKGQPESAEHVFQYAVFAYSNHIEPYDEYGRFLLKQEKNLTLARKYLIFSLKKLKNKTHIFHELSVLYWKLGKFKKSLFYSKKSILKNPGNFDAKMTHAVISLLNGDFQNGWKNYSSRMFRKRQGFSYVETFTEERFFNGNGHLIVFHEQGIGDEIMFANLFIDLIKTSFKITAVFDFRLIPILSRSFPSVCFISEEEFKKTENYFNIFNKNKNLYFCYVASLAKFFRSNINSFPVHGGYLKEDKLLKNYYFNQINIISGNEKKHRKKIIGITWRSLSPTTRRLRNIPLENWGFIKEYKNLIFVNLQFGEVSKEVEDFIKKEKVKLISFPKVNPMKEMDNFSALVASCDLVIGIDNSTIHLSASLNIPTWVMLPIGCDYRWMTEIEYSPWYPSVKLFRQKKPLEWIPVIDDLKIHLRNFENENR